jgi:hypothetical protein
MAHYPPGVSVGDKVKVRHTDLDQWEIMIEEESFKGVVVDVDPGRVLVQSEPAAGRYSRHWVNTSTQYQIDEPVWLVVQRDGSTRVWRRVVGQELVAIEALQKERDGLRTKIQELQEENSTMRRRWAHIRTIIDLMAENQESIEKTGKAR